MLFGKHINKYYLKYGWLLLIGMAALILVDYMQLEIPEFYRMMVNGLNEGAVEVDGATLPFDLNFLLDKICLPMIFIILALISGRFLWRVTIFGAGIGAESSLRMEMFDRLKGLSGDFYQKNKVGNLMSLFTNDLETIEECFGWGFLMFIDALFLGALSIVKMLLMNPFLTLLCMIPMGILLAVGLVLSKYMMKKWEIRQQAFSDLSDFSQEIFSGIAVVKAFVKETVELLAFGKLNSENERANINYTRISTLLTVGVTLFVESVICVILGYGGFLVHEKVFTAGQLVEFIGYFTSVIWPIMAISELIELRSRGKASLKRISQLLDERPTVTDREGAVDLETLDGDIEFRHLDFTYPDASVEALHDVSLHVKPGEFVGVIGKTGSGKTTLVDLLLRTHNVPDGTLFVDGKDVNTISIRSLREKIAYVPQDNFLFSDTIARNIALADLEAPSLQPSKKKPLFRPTAEETEAHLERIVSAAKMSDVHENIEGFKDGYYTVLGERGVTISGGQKQRISIARALLKDASVLILDDAVSAVDVKTEKAILENLKNTRSGKTTFLIAHRVSTVKDLTKVLYMEDGRVTGFGTHEELLRTCPAYRRTVELQHLEDAQEGDAARRERKSQRRKEENGYA